MKQRNVDKKTADLRNRKIILSTLWIFVVMNYMFCDVISFMDSSMLKQYIAGIVNGMQMTQGILLGGAFLMEISISMILFSRILKFKVNRLANIFSGAITTIVQTMTLVGQSTNYYLFFSIIEISCTAFIVWYAWNWTNPENSTQVIFDD